MITLKVDLKIWDYLIEIKQLLIPALCGNCGKIGGTLGGQGASTTWLCNASIKKQILCGMIDLSQKSLI